MPWGALFTQVNVDLFNSNVALRNTVQPVVSRQTVVDKWKSMPILYPQEPKEMGNSKYRHLVLYNGFTSDLKAELRRIFDSEAKIDQHVAHMRSVFEIGGQRKSGRHPKHQTPSRFPEKCYWPNPMTCLLSSKSTPVKSISPAKATPSALDPPLPPKKRYLENQQENQGASATPVPVPGGSTPVAAQGGTNLQIQNVYSLSDPFYSTPSQPTARKKTGGKTPSRIKPKLVSRQVTFKKPVEDYEDSQSIEFLGTYIPDLMYQYLQVYGREPQKAKEISHLLQAAQRTLNQIVAWKDRPVIIDENVNEEDLNVHVAFVSEMRKNLQLLRYFTPWLVEEEDVMSCMEHIQMLEDLIPKFESVTSLPKIESVQQVNNVKGWVLSLMTGCIELRDPRKESVTLSGDKGAHKPTPIQPPAPASLLQSNHQLLQAYKTCKNIFLKFYDKCTI